MFPNWLVPQLILTLFGLVFIFWMRRRYKLGVSLQARRKEYQYRVFALRDRAIRMVVNHTVPEDDDSWKVLYAFINETAKAVTSDKFFSSRLGVRFFLMIIKAIPTPPRDLKDIEKAPKQIKQLWAETAVNLLAITWDGNTAFRWCFNTLIQVKSVSKFIVSKIPDAVGKYKSLVAIQHKLDGDSLVRLASQ